MAAQYDPNFTSGLEYALSVAGGQNVPNMIAPGVSYSSEFPTGYTTNGLAPPPMPAPMPATLEDFQRVDPFAALNAQLSDSLANPTSAMYGNPVAATPASAGMGGGLGAIGNNIGIGGGFTGGAPLKTYSDYANPLFSLDPADSALLGLTGPNPNALGNVQSDLANAIAAAEAADAYGASMPNEGVMGVIDKLSAIVKDPSLAKETKDRALEQLMEELAIRENTKAAESGSQGVSSKGYGAQGKTSEKAEGLVSIPGALAAFSLNPAAYLYSGAGSSFESGRNEYTESGQYDIDKAARDAEFDAMREQQRIDAGLPYKKLTPEETQQAVQKLQASIGFGGAMTPRGRNRIPAMAAEPVREPVPQPVKGYAPFDFANIQSILNNLG